MIVTNTITISGTKLKSGRISHLTNCRKPVGKPPIDWHRTQGNDKGMDVKRGNHRSVEETEQGPDTNGRKNPKHDRCATPGRTIRGKYQGSTHGSQSVNGTDRKIGSSRDNCRRNSNRHDCKETRVFSNLDKCRRVEKLVDRLKRRNLLTSGIGLESSFAFAVRSHLKFGHLNRTAENCQEQPERDDYQNETCFWEFREIETEFSGGRHRIGNIELSCADTLPNCVPLLR